MSGNDQITAPLTHRFRKSSNKPDRHAATLTTLANISESICRWTFPRGCAGLFQSRELQDGAGRTEESGFCQRRKWGPLLCIQQSPEAKDISRHMCGAGLPGRLPAGHAGFS